LKAVIIHPPARLRSLPGNPRCIVTTNSFETVRPSNNLTGAEINTSFRLAWPPDPWTTVILTTSKFVTMPSVAGSKATVATL
jgi:hypothetical protein